MKIISVANISVVVIEAHRRWAFAETTKYTNAKGQQIIFHGNA